MPINSPAATTSISRAKLLDFLNKPTEFLLQELSGAIKGGLDINELAETALRTWSLPELAEHRAELVAEVPVYGRLAGEHQRLIAGRADAVSYQSGKPGIVFNWKGDVAPDTAARRPTQTNSGSTSISSAPSAARSFT